MGVASPRRRRGNAGCVHGRARDGVHIRRRGRELLAHHPSTQQRAHAPQTTPPFPRTRGPTSPSAPNSSGTNSEFRARAESQQPGVELRVALGEGGCVCTCEWFGWAPGGRGADESASGEALPTGEAVGHGERVGRSERHERADEDAVGDTDAQSAPKSYDAAPERDVDAVLHAADVDAFCDAGQRADTDGDAGKIDDTEDTD
ncbi:hypothetical protein C8J57DRAFT_1301717 [Mycena rebaudengoi]|nr:hypothetical protein C8J57DRAFT_1301717 [Mycena rebaudengoi]